MNKKNIAMRDVIVCLLIFVPNEGHGMHRILRATQMVTGACLVGGGMLIEGYGRERLKKSELDGFEMSKDVQLFTRSVIRKIDVQAAESVTLLVDKNDAASEWSAEYDKVILVDPIINKKLEIILHKKDIIEAEKKFLALHTMLIKHELKHYISQDSHNLIYACAVIPAMIQTGSTALRYGFNRIFKIEQPKKIIPALLRSSLSVASLIPKIGVSFLGFIIYRQYIERQADKFACEHAETRQELEEYHKFFMDIHYSDQKSFLHNKGIDLDSMSPWKRYFLMKFDYFTHDPAHPCPEDRGTDVQYYLGKWDEEHKN